MVAESVAIGASLVGGALSGALLERLAALFSGGLPRRGARTALSALLAALIAPVLLLSLSSAPKLLVAVALLSVLFAAALTDLQMRQIPNLLSGGGLVLVVAVTALFEPQFVAERLLFALFLFTFLLFAALIRPGGLGLGDVKLAAVIGAALGASSIIALLLAFVAGASIGGLIAARRGLGLLRTATIPLAPFLAAGALAAVLICG